MDFSTIQVSKPKGTRNTLNAPPNDQWVYMFHPNSWDLIEGQDGAEWLPKLRHWTQKAGVNGIRGLRGGEGINETAARARFVDDGWIFITPESVEAWIDNGPNDSGYLRALDGTRGPVFVDIWSIPEKIGAGRNAQVVFSRDKEGFDDFRRELLKRGMIPEIQDAVVKMYVKRQRKRAGRRRSQSHNPVVAAGIDKENVKLEAMKTAKAKKASKKKAKATKGASNGK
tara:strand:+ start:2320 stop:3000 length:681 start_codon:yes stop_codon:yes gene_type:complete